MIKKITLTLLASAVALSLVACGNGADAPPAANETVTANAAVNQAEEDAPTAETEPTDIATPSADVFDFTFRGTVISLNQNMAEVLDTLGEPTGVRQTPSCAFDGYDRIFGFGAVNVHTYPVGDEDFVQVISIRDDSVTTPGGIRLGDSWERVLGVYGDEYTQDFSIFTFTRGDTMLSFYVDDGVVLEITYALVME